jgi:ABC-type sugar transport system substrate-binding protein
MRHGARRVAMVMVIASIVGGYGAASSAASTSVPGGELPESGEVVFFGLSQQNPYVAQWHEGARAQAEEYGWTLRYVESQNSQQEQDGQITQLLGSPDQPLGVILAPFQGEAAAASMQAIKEAGIPLIIIDAEPPVEQEPLYDIYTGANDILSAETSADLLVAAAEAAGIELEGGLIIGCPWDWLGCSRRRDAFPEALAEVAPDAEIVASYPSEGFGPSEGYEVAAQVVPAEAGSFNFVYTLNDAIGDGVIQALEENGLVAGEDVLVVGGTCLGVATNQMVIDGKLAGTAVQSPFVEGQLTVINLAQFLNNGGEVLPGSTDVSPDAPPSLDEPPHKYNYMPNPAVETAEDFQEVTIWGRTAEELCSYT